MALNDAKFHHPTQPASRDMSSGSGKKPAQVTCWTLGNYQPKDDFVAEEAAVALVYNGISHAVMMATPADLESFALGFSLSEGILKRADELLSCDIVESDAGVEVRMEITTRRLQALKEHRRNLTGRTGCGLCGLESLKQLRRIFPVMQPQSLLSGEAIQKSLSVLGNVQLLQQQTGAAHGAAWYDLEGNIQLIREDIGRHNALDKLIGTLKQQQIDTSQGFVLISSRASSEMVQKMLTVGIQRLVAVSAATSMAIELANNSGMQLFGFARTGRFLCYSPANAQG